VSDVRPPHGPRRAPDPHPWLRLIGVLLPALIGALLAFAFGSGLLPLTIVTLRIQTDTAYIVLGSGLLLSAALGLAWWWRVRWHRALARAVGAERQAATETHRRFIRRLNHELKNPLTAVRAGLINVDALRQEGQGQDTGRRSLLNVQRQVDRLGRLADQLRKLADLEAGDVEQAPVDLAELIAEAIELAGTTPERGARNILTDVQRRPWPLGPVRGDRDLLLLALYNLLDNALKFSRPDAVVEIHAREDGARATIEVIDAGQGIAPDDLPHITEELYRGGEAQGIEGSGLGLALVERIAALHGGDLRIRSRPGQGTVATLRLPLA
jgi:signal transduction histidine kinase